MLLNGKLLKYMIMIPKEQLLNECIGIKDIT